VRRRRATPRDFESEAHLCEVFAEKARAAGLEVYPEVEEWDLLLVAGDVQVGIEAKLRASLDAVAQAYNRSLRALRRPHCAVVLVPFAPEALLAVCHGLDLGAWEPSTWHPRDVRFLPRLPGGDAQRLEVPRYDVPHLRAGAPAPRPLTKWREGALRLCLRLRERGWVTSADFKALGLSRRWWTGPDGCLAPDGYEGRLARFVARQGAKLPDEGWEAVTEQIRAEERERGSAA
jgi:hypothetical protein